MNLGLNTNAARHARHPRAPSDETLPRATRRARPLQASTQSLKQFRGRASSPDFHRSRQGVVCAFVLLAAVLPMCPPAQAEERGPRVDLTKEGCWLQKHYGLRGFETVSVPSCQIRRKPGDICYCGNPRNRSEVEEVRTPKLADLQSVIYGCWEHHPLPPNLPQEGMSEALWQKVARHLLARGNDVTESRFKEEWLSILDLELGLLGNTGQVRESFSSHELNDIHAYADRIRHELYEGMDKPPTDRIGPDDGSGIPDAVWQNRLDEKLGELDDIVHMWDYIAAFAGFTPGAASVAPAASRPRRPVAGLHRSPPKSSAAQSEASARGGSGSSRAPGKAAPGLGESLIKPERTTGLKVDAAMQEHRDKTTYRQGSGRKVESAHGLPSSAVADVSGYRRNKAVTTLLPKNIHRRFDSGWKAWSRQRVAEGQKEVRVDEFLRVLDEAAASVPELQGRMADTMSWCFRHEAYQTLGLEPDTMIRLPYSKRPLFVK